MIGHAGLRRLDGIIWTIIGLVAVIELMAVAFGGFTLVVSSYAGPGCTCIVLLAAARYYNGRRNDPKLGSALEATAQLAAFAAVGAPLSYIAASAALSLQDAAFAAADRALGFDWRALLSFMEHRPGFHVFMRVIYASLAIQTTAVVLLLGFTGRLPWLRVYLLAFMFAALTTIALSALLPAEGAWLYYGIRNPDPVLLPVSSTSWPVFEGLRDGTFRQLMAVGAEGIITFPSLHAALTVILAAAFWPVPIARWFGAALNMLMLAATPIDGSHYLIDVVAGVAIAITSLMAARALVASVSGEAPAAARIHVKAAVAPRAAPRAAE